LLVVGEAAPPNFVNEILVTNLTEPIALQFLPDGRMLIVGRLGTVWVRQPGAPQIDPTPFLQLTNISNNSSENGVFSLTLDPNFAQNQQYYVFYTSASPLVDRVSRFTANGNTTSLATEQVIWQDTATPGVTHHGGSLGFGPDGKLYVSVGEHFVPNLAQQLDNYRGKILRIESDGTAPTDNPFYQGGNQPRDYVWALGLRNPFRMSFDGTTGKLYIADVGGNNQATAQEEVNVGLAGANYGWPNCEGPCADPNVTDPLFFYSHNNVHASITGGFVYRGTQFPVQYRGSYFYGDFERNFIKGVTLNAAGQVVGTFDFEPADGSSDGPYGNITYLTEGPDGALYYVDYNYDASGNATSPGSIRRIRYTLGNQPPTVVSTANPTTGTAPLTVNFSSTGTTDPDNNPLTYSWDFGDGGSSSQPNPVHTYQNVGLYTARLTVSDGQNQVLGNPINISVGNAPNVTINSPTNGVSFIARDVISFSGSANDPEDGSLGPGALTWHIVFHHGSHTHPIVGPLNGAASGTYTIPASGHDYSGQTSYEIILTATDSDGLQNSTSVFIFPNKVNLTFNTVPSGLDIFLDGIRISTPLTLDTLIGFEHNLQAIDQTISGTSYVFQSWSDGGAQTHLITTPNSNQTYTATYTAGSVLPLLHTSLDSLAAVQTPVRGTGSGSSVNTSPANDFVSAQVGNGIRIDAANEAVQFLQTSGGTQNVELDQGTVDFWYRPNSSHTDGIFHPLVSIGAWATPGSIHIMKQNAANENGLGVQFRDAAGNVFETDVPETAYNFTPGTLVHIRATWDFSVAPGVRNVHVYVNDVEAPMIYVTTGPLTMPAESATRFIYVGNRGDASGFNGNGVLDELSIYPTAFGPTQQDLTPPVRSNGQPSGDLPSGTTFTNISLTTDEPSTCRYTTTPGTSYSAMTNVFSTTGVTAHSTQVAGLSDGGTYTFFVRCLDNAGNANSDDFNISFSVNTASPVNQSPTVNAGSDQTVTLPANASLNGVVTDDGLPNPPASFTTNWTQFSGPGTTTFGNANALNTTANFSTAGTYVLRLTANDGALSSSDDVTITVNSAATSGSLSGNLITPASTINLTSEGSLDWTHWGLNSSADFDRKANVASQISNYTLIGTSTANRQGASPVSYSWSDGTPRASATNSPTGVYVLGTGSGFQLTIPADQTDRSLKVYLGVWSAQGRFEATLSDNSAAPFVDTSLVSQTSGVTRAYVLNYRAGSAGQTLRIRWTLTSSFHLFGNITLQAATLVFSGGPPANSSPTANAGTDQTITLPANANLTGTASDDGLPNPPGTLTTTWSQVSGPAIVNFGNAGNLNTSANFTTAGTYVLRLTVSDSVLSATDEVTINVNPSQPVNQPPTVNAGMDQSVTLPAAASLSGTVNDDGLPNPPASFTTTWSQVNGPGTVNFANINSLNTTASFSAAGTYVLRLTADDSALSGTDDVTITVNPGQGGSAVLTGSLATPSGPVNLSTEGIVDWAHWGLIDPFSFNHKSGVAQQISNFTLIGNSGVNRYLRDPNTFSWTGGTPTASAVNSPNGVWTLGAGNGFQITVPASTTSRTLRLYVSASTAQGRLEASLSGGSAPVYTDTSLVHTGSGANTQGVYTINFRAASNGQTLTIRWTILNSSGPYGNVTMQAATLF
jgi:glucose/arabinose dehydrogenase